MTTVAQVAHSLQNVLISTANVAARRSGFIRRQRQLTGATFVQGLVFGWMAHPAATYDHLAQAVTRAGSRISPQGLEQRFSPEAAQCLQQVLEAVTEVVVSVGESSATLLQRFTAVWLWDSSTVPLPQDLQKDWPGSGRSPEQGGAAALKLHTALDLRGGQLAGPHLTPGRTDDHVATGYPPVPQGALRITDLGYYALRTLRDLAEAGAFWLCRAQVSTILFTEDGQRHTLVELLAVQRGDVVERSVTLGVRDRLPARLIAFRLDPQAAARRRRKVRYIARRKARPASPERLALCSWDVCITNVPAEKLTAAESRVLLRARWQIELLFKLWKSEGHLERSRSRKTSRILCELYAKLIGLIIQHWCLVLGCWRILERSLTKAGRVVREYALLLAWAMDHPRRLQEVLRQLTADLQISCRVNPRKAKPNHCQLLQGPSRAA
jgi:hypothetical protein